MNGLEFGLEFFKEKALKGLDFCWTLGAETLIIPAPPANCQFIWMASAFGMSATQPILG